MANGKLNEAAKTYIVQSLACYDTPSAIVEAVRKDYGESITRQTVEGYDPNKRAGVNLSKKWRALFDETRKAFLEDTAGIAISHRAVRLRALQRMAEKAEDRGNMVLAASLLEQAAKEMGEAYTNRQRMEHTGKDGGPIESRHSLDPSKLSDAALSELMAARRGTDE